MADTNAPIRVPDDVDELTFELPGGQTFKVALLDTLEWLDLKKKELEQTPGATRYQMLKELAQYVADRNGGVLLSRGQADWLQDELTTVLLHKKKQRSERLASTLRSLSSTESTPSD